MWSGPEDRFLQRHCQRSPELLHPRPPNSFRPLYLSLSAGILNFLPLLMHQWSEDRSLHFVYVPTLYLIS